MRRAILAVCGTAVGTALLVGAKSAATLADHGVAVGAATDGTALAPSGSAPASGSAKPAPTTTGGSPVPTRRAPSATSRPTGATTTPPSSNSRYRDGTFSAPATYKYGTVTVTIVISGGRITEASATYPTSGQSAVINGKAIPKLNAETLQAQDADIATVSGATLTSDAYRRSLQAALDKAGA